MNEIKLVVFKIQFHIRLSTFGILKSTLKIQDDYRNEE